MFVIYFIHYFNSKHCPQSDVRNTCFYCQIISAASRQSNFSFPTGNITSWLGSFLVLPLDLPHPAIFPLIKPQWHLCHCLLTLTINHQVELYIYIYIYVQRHDIYDNYNCIVRAYFHFCSCCPKPIPAEDRWWHKVCHPAEIERGSQSNGYNKCRQLGPPCLHYSVSTCQIRMSFIMIFL